MTKVIAYFDNAATTQPLPEARDAFLTAFEKYGNPSSIHTAGLEARDALAEARSAVKATLGVKNEADSLIFCGSGTEANNLALLGVAGSKPSFSGKRIIISEGEHPSVYKCAELLKSKGFDVVTVKTKGGVVNTDEFKGLMTPETFLISIMTANNESGAVYDIKELCKIAKSVNPGVIFHTDATQAYMKMPISVVSLGVDMMTVSAHKIGAFKGTGALYVKESIVKSRSIIPVILGGGQENGFRSGTENIPGIIAFAAAASLRAKQLEENIGKLKALREYIVSSLENTEIKVNSAPNPSPAIISVTLPKIKSETILHFLSGRGVCVSSGSACSSHHAEISRAMRAYGLSATEADCTIRISLSPENTKEQADLLLKALLESTKTLIRLR